MPLQNPFLNLDAPPYAARDTAVRCKRKLLELGTEDCAMNVSKKEKRDNTAAERHYWAAMNDGSQQTQAGQHGRQYDQSAERSMEVGLEIVHNSVFPVYGCHPPQRPAIHTPAHVPPPTEPGTFPMMDVEDDPCSGGDVHFKPSDSVRLQNMIEFCSFHCTGAPRSPVSNRIRCSCRGHYDQPDDQHYVSDIY